MSTERRQPPFMARTIRRFAPFIILAWVALILVVTLASVGGGLGSGNPIAGAGRAKAFRITDAQGCTVGAGNDTHGQGLQRIQFR